MDFKELENSSAEASWFLFLNDELLVKEKEGTITIPSTSDIKIFDMPPTTVQPIGMFKEHKAFVANFHNENIPEGFSFQKLRPLHEHIEDESFWFAFRAYHIMNWMKTSKFCGCCGSIMTVSTQEIAMKCTNCDHIIYPRISPAIIVAVIRDNKILLARANRFPPNRYSVIAGFVEPGETLEDCVRRELLEEVGVEVDMINYFGSQPWPFLDSLMIAFTARCSNEKITIDNQEIVDAGWYSPHNLPDIPDKASIARRLIDWFVEKYGSI
jgi:NAD+ diphosphatase